MRRAVLMSCLPVLLMAGAPVAKNMSLTTPDGYTIQGTLTIPEGKGKHPVVILAHQFRSDSAGWASLAEKLQQRGLATLTIDLRGHGKSTQKNGASVAVTDDFDASAKTVGFDKIPEDLVQVAAWVRKQPGVNGRYVGLAGSSVGAFSVLTAASSVHPTAILALSPAGSSAFGKDAQTRMLASVTKAHAALMAFASLDDKEAADNVAALRPLFGSCVRTFEGKDHGFNYLKDHSDVMAVFLAEYLTHHHAGVAPDKAKAAAAPQAPMTQEMVR